MRCGGRIFITFHKHFDRSFSDRLMKQPLFQGRSFSSINPELLQIIIISCITTFLPCSSSFSGFMIILRFGIYLFAFDTQKPKDVLQTLVFFKLFIRLLVLYFLNGKGGKINNKSFWHFSCMNLYLFFQLTHTSCVSFQWIWGEKIHSITQVLNRFPWRNNCHADEEK